MWISADFCQLSPGRAPSGRLHWGNILPRGNMPTIVGAHAAEACVHMMDQALADIHTHEMKKKSLIKTFWTLTWCTIHDALREHRMRKYQIKNKLLTSWNRLVSSKSRIMMTLDLLSAIFFLQKDIEFSQRAHFLAAVTVRQFANRWPVLFWGLEQHVHPANVSRAQVLLFWCSLQAIKSKKQKK